MIFSEHLKGHTALAARDEKSQEQLQKIRDEFNVYTPQFAEYSASVYCAGSLGRGDVGSKSDLDLFLVTTRGEGRRKSLQEIRLLAHAINVNETLNYGPFSNDGQYLKVYSLDKMLQSLGAPSDDSENLFTARMLMLLESRCVCNDKIYNESLKKIINHYFRDHRGKQSFRPLFLLNDLLRYWRTLCLNYEQIRDDPDRPWRKKNINLKFSRMLTVFGTVLPIVISEMNSASEVRKLVSLSPHERFAQGLDKLGDNSLLKEYNGFLDDYESFLSLKETMGDAGALTDQELDRETRAAANRFSDFFYKVTTHNRVNTELKKFLVL